MSPKRTLTIEEAAARERAPRNAASMSFNDAQVCALDEVLRTILRSGDARPMRKSKALREVHEKLPTMYAAIERQKERRKALGL